MSHNSLNINYCTHDNYKVNKKYNFYIIHLNSKSIRKQKLDQIELIINQLTRRPKVVVISETRITESEKPFYNLSGYTSYHSVRNEKAGGGVSVLLRRVYVQQYLEKLYIKIVTSSSSIYQNIVLRFVGYIDHLIT